MYTVILAPKMCGGIEGFRQLLGVECDVAIIIINVLCIGVFVALMLVGLGLIKTRCVLFLHLCCTLVALVCTLIVTKLIYSL